MVQFSSRESSLGYSVPGFPLPLQQSDEVAASFGFANVGILVLLAANPSSHIDFHSFFKSCIWGAV